MTRRKLNTWQPNAITSIIRSSQDPPSDSQSLSLDLSSSQESPCNSQLSAFNEESESLTLVTHAGKENTNLSVLRSDRSSEEYETLSFDNARIETASNGGDAESRSTELFQGASFRASLPQPRSEANLKVEGKGQHADTCAQVRIDVGRPNQEIGLTNAPSRTLKRTASIARLSTSLDGKASVILKGETPSPPSKSQVLVQQVRPILQRSQSSISVGGRQPSVPNDLKSSMLLPRTHGRSRDVRSWEFYCDPEVRESLTKTAEDDQRGSAAGPIQLIRSSSAAGRQALASSGSKQNLQMRRQGSAKRKYPDQFEKPRHKLARTASSSARFQSTEKPKSDNANSLKGSTSPQSELTKDRLGDSDKENWDPDNSQSHHLRPRPSMANVSRGTKNRRVLQENQDTLSHSSSLGAMMEREALGGCAKRFNALEDKLRERSLQVDPEISDFMRSCSAEKENKGEDLDAVQNLLSLSQGAWA